MKFEFIAKHRGIWPVSWICEALGVSRSAFTPGLFVPLRSHSNDAAHRWNLGLLRPAPALALMKSSLARSARASSRATGHTAHGVCGTTSWPKAYHVACTASSG